VAFKLCEGLTVALGHDRRRFQEAYLDLAALGTIADVMPLVGENRVIAKFGLERLAATKKQGLLALMKEAKLDLRPGQSLTSTHVGFRLGPRLNAAGRIDDAAIALQLLLSTEESEAATLASEIEAVNTARKAEQQRITDEAIEYVKTHGLDEKNVIFVTNPNWHAGVVGIVASRLVETFRRPTFVGVVDEATGFGKASARSIPGFHLADAIRSMPEYLEGGGHAMAAGCSFYAENLPAIQESLHEYAGQRLSAEDFLPVRVVDAEIELSEINYTVATALQLLEPCGAGNPSPVFMTRNASLVSSRPTKTPVHAQFTAGKNGQFSNGIYFNHGESLLAIPAGSSLDFLYSMTVDEFNGKRGAKMELKDFRLATPVD
jgi:single-stranded-DNA-specific exonuclease